ncbi:MAG: ABC transporter ATP-binding protein [Chloroflexi bacterium]|nr:ABC transporter ATP-binding protein [Chloroflexota bacterium]
MAYWGGGNAGGWSGDQRGVQRGRAVDGWDYAELGRVYEPDLVKRLFPFLGPYKVQAIVATIAMLVFAIASYAQPYVMAVATESIVEKLRSGTPGELAAVEDEILRFGALLVGLATFSFGSAALQRLMTGYVGHRILRDLRSQMFEHLNKLSLSFFDREEVGRVMSRVTSDVVTLQELITSGFLNILADIVGLALIVLFLFLLDPMLAVISLSVIPLLMIFMVWWQTPAAHAFIRVRQGISIVNGSINENVSGVRIVQSLNREDENLRQFDRLNRVNLDANMDAVKLQAAVIPMVEMLSTVATAVVLIVIGVRTFAGDLGAGEALAYAIGFLLYIQRFFNPVRDIVLQYTMLQRAMAGAHRIFEVLDTEPEIVDPPDAKVLPDVEGRIDFNEVDFSYVKNVPVLRKFDLHIEPGETIAFVGHTGAGKTTVTALVNRSYDIEGGSILVDGTDLREIQRASLTRRMSVVLQEPYLFSGTVADNIRYGRLDATDEEIAEAARAVGAHDFVERLSDGYDTELHERGTNLSVGQRQLIAFARAIIAEPRILILDEATANIDTHSERLIQQALKTILRGRTSLVIAHRLSTIRSADRIVVMRDGEIAEIGNHEELIAADGIYADLYRMTYRRSEEDGDGFDADGLGGNGAGGAATAPPRESTAR